MNNAIDCQEHNAAALSQPLCSGTACGALMLRPYISHSLVRRNRRPLRTSSTASSRSPWTRNLCSGTACGALMLRPSISHSRSAQQAPDSGASSAAAALAGPVFRILGFLLRGDLCTRPAQPGVAVRGLAADAFVPFDHGCAGIALVVALPMADGCWPTPRKRCRPSAWCRVVSSSSASRRDPEARRPARLAAPAPASCNRPCTNNETIKL